MTVMAIARVLGGDKVLRRRVGTAQELVSVTRDGLPAQVLDVLSEQLNLSRGAVAQALGISARTLSRRSAETSTLTAGESDRAVRLARIVAQALETLGTREKAATWLMTPNRAMAGERPFARMDTDAGAETVATVLGRIAYGVFS